MSQHLFQEGPICQASPRRLPIVAENSPIHLHSPTLTPLPLMLDESQVLSGSLFLRLGQTGEIAIVQLAHRSRCKLGFQLSESAFLDRIDIAARLLCLLGASLLGSALGCLLVKVRCRTLLSRRRFPACLCSEVSYAVRFDAAGLFAWDDGWGCEEDHATELVTLVALANFERDGEVRLVGEDICLDRRTLPV